MSSRRRYLCFQEQEADNPAADEASLPQEPRWVSGAESWVGSVIPWAPATLILRGFKLITIGKISASFYFIMPKCFQTHYFILFKSYKLYFNFLPKIPRSWKGTLKKKFNMPAMTFMKQKKANFNWKSIRLKITYHTWVYTNKIRKRGQKREFWFINFRAIWIFTVYYFYIKLIF